MKPNDIGPAGPSLCEDILKYHKGTTIADLKADGHRIQIHKQGDRIEAFTSGNNPYFLELYPDIADSLKRLPDCIVDGEIIAEGNPGLSGFGAVGTRFRKQTTNAATAEYLASGVVEDYPLEIRIFDTLHWEGNSTIDLPWTERRKLTEKIDEAKISPSMYKEISDPNQLFQMFQLYDGNGYEGFVCKNADTLYKPGTKTKAWIKLKRAETVDLAVLGVYMKDDNVSMLLCGSYNPQTERFETLAKVNPKRGGLDKVIIPQLKPYFTSEKPTNVTVRQKLPIRKAPTFYVPPNNTMVVEVDALRVNQTTGTWTACGLEGNDSYSLSITKLMRIRDDKTVHQATTTQQIGAAYARQIKQPVKITTG